MNAASVTCMVVVVASAAGVLAGAPPELASTLALARSSACKQAAALIEQGDYHSALGTLQSAQSGVFPWQIEVTNGYQNGFFLNALMGYCLEQADDPPKAYRAYQNSRAYIDEDKSIATPEPRLEVYVGIGRTCNAVGRYTDSFTWLDAARYEGAGDSNIVMAADRALAKRAVDIGDYYDAITNLEDLASITVLTRDEYKQLAQLYFWTHRDREGFRHLLNGLTLLGIDNDLGVKDPIVDCFLNNIMRADVAEVTWLNDVFGYAIATARSLKGDEDYLAMLVNARNVLSRAYDCLMREDDLAKVKTRIDAIAERLQANVALGQTRAVAEQSYVRRAAPTAMQKTDQIHHGISAHEGIEDVLMQADILVRKGNKRPAATMYSNVLCLCGNTNLALVYYDGTTVGSAARIGMLRALDMVDTNMAGAAPGQCTLSSFREYDVYLWSQVRRGLITNTTVRLPDMVSCAVPAAYPAYLSYLERYMAAEQRRRNGVGIVNCFRQRWARKAEIDSEHFKLLFAANAAIGKTEEAYLALQDGLTHTSHELERMTFIELCGQSSSWASDKELARLDTLALASLMSPLLGNQPMGFNALHQYYQPAKEVATKGSRLRSLLAEGDLATLLQMVTNRPSELTQAGDLFRAAVFLGENGETNLAFNLMQQAYTSRSSLAKQAGGDDIRYPVLETSHLEQWLPCASPVPAQRYSEWIAKRTSDCTIRGDQESLNAIKASKAYAVAQTLVATTNTMESTK